MQFDRTRIAIRERDLFDLLDLALQVVRLHWRALLIAALVGMTPFAILNYWLLRDLPFVEEQDHVAYVWRMVMLVVFELPLASVPITLLLGQAMFFERFDTARLARQILNSLPQLIIYQLLLRGLLMPQALFWAHVDRALAPIVILYFPFWLLPLVGWPYLNEAILLERNPIRTKAGNLSAWKRCRILHKGHHGDIFARLLGSACLAAAMTAAIWLATWHVRTFFSREPEFDRSMFTVHLPLALWIVAAFFAVVRFLSYLDLRIRREGWEVELMLRAEAERLARQHQYAG